MKPYDCSMSVEIPSIEVEAKDAAAAKRAYVEAVKRLIDDLAAVLAIEVDVVD